MTKTLLVFGDKNFKVTIPDDAKVTFGPWSPPSDKSYHIPGGARGTLRIYKSEKNILAVFSGVTGFRDLSLDYAEEVAKEEGATIWKSDRDGYHREEKRKVEREWVRDEPIGLPEGIAYTERAGIGLHEREDA